MKVKTLPVYSKLAEAVPPEIAAKLPPNWRLSQHQLETYQALIGGEYDVVFNTAMTGDGKSLAAYLPTLVKPDWRAFGIYPTIELSRDQERQFKGYNQDFNRNLKYDAVWGAKLGQLIKEHNFKRRGEMLKERFNNYQVLLSNPDIFNLVMNYSYGSNIFSAHELPYSLAINFQTFIFDEFHIFQMPQIISAVTAMLYFHEFINRPGAIKFLFSSATPDETLIEMLNRLGSKHLNYKIIPGIYTDQQQANYRPVLHPTTLNIHQLGEKQSVEDWLQNNLRLIIDHWQQAKQDGSPLPKGVIIVNSVAAARRIVKMLKNLLEYPHGITIGENTGLTDEERRTEAMRDKALVVGTSTIDVGIDFSISFLIFESLDAGTFLQRLGRLGRVKMKEIPFGQYEAHALINGFTPWIYAKLESGLAEAGVAEGGDVDRPQTLRDVVQNAFPRYTSFIRYAKRWGVLQAAHVVTTLERNKDKAYDSLAMALRERYALLFNLKDFSSVVKHYWGLAGEKNDKRLQHDCRLILDEVLSFRGSSPFQVGVWDDTVDPPAFLAYDVFALARSAIYHVVSTEAFETAVINRFSQLLDQNVVWERIKYVMQGKGEQPLLLRVTEFLPESERLILRIGEDLTLFSDQVCVLAQLGIAEPKTCDALGDINMILKRQDVVCYATRRDPGELRRRLNLPSLFPLYRVQDMNRNREWTITFGKAALLLEAETLWLRNKDEENEPIIC